jgi:hypothetical protein
VTTTKNSNGHLSIVDNHFNCLTFLIFSVKAQVIIRVITVICKACFRGSFFFGGLRLDLHFGGFEIDLGGVLLLLWVLLRRLLLA